jgi:uncharacterized protein YciI
MPFVVIGKDRGGGELRRRHRAAHLEFVAGKQAPVIYAGPLLEAGAMIGSLFVFDFPDRATLDAHLAQDPYFREAIFETVDIYESKWMVPEREPGFLAAEAEKARAAEG